MYPANKRKRPNSNQSARKKRRTEPEDFTVTVTPEGTRSVRNIPDISVAVTSDGQRLVQYGPPPFRVTVTPDGERSVRLGTARLVRNKRDMRNRTAPVTSEKPAALPAKDEQPMHVKDTEPVKDTPSATTTITTQHEPPVAVATYSYATNYSHLKPENDRLQTIQNSDRTYLWHRSHPDCYIVAEDETGEFIRHDQTPTGEFFLKANRFKKAAPQYGDEFWLTFDGQGYKVDNYAETKPAGIAQKVPWEHIVQHVYDHFTDFSIKEVHTFWPLGTTEADLLKHLVNALNNKGVVNALKIDNVPYSATVRRDRNQTIKTFFLDRPTEADDQFTPDQLSDLGDLIGRRPPL